MSTIPSMEEMLKAGVHFGHQASRWHPKMEPFLYTVRNGVHVIDLKKTQAYLEKAAEFVKKTVAQGGDLLFIGTKTQAQPLMKQYAQACNMPYINDRWLGGTLTNFSEIKKVIKKYLNMKKAKEAGEWEKKYTKKEQVELTKELNKLEQSVSGIAQMDRLPKAVFIVDIRAEKTALAEAAQRNIPIVALCDSNVNPEKVDYVIPANDDATRGLEMMIKIISDACKEGLNERKAKPAPAAKKQKKPVKKKAEAKKEEKKSADKTESKEDKREEKKTDDK